MLLRMWKFYNRWDTFCLINIKWLIVVWIVVETMFTQNRTNVCFFMIADRASFLSIPVANCMNQTLIEFDFHWNWTDPSADIEELKIKSDCVLFVALIVIGTLYI